MILKLTSSLKGFQVVSDEGVVFQTSVYAVKSMIENADAGHFVLLTRLPLTVSTSRFPQSPLFQGETKIDMNKYDSAVAHKDSFGNAHAKFKGEKVFVEDSEVDWS